MPLFFLLDTILSIIETYYTIIYKLRIITLVDLLFLLHYYYNTILFFCRRTARPRADDILAVSQMPCVLSTVQSCDKDIVST